MENFNFVEWKKQANKILVQYHERIIFMPDTSLMPYEHMDVCARLGDWLARKSSESVKITLSADEVAAVRVALSIYSGVLEDIHREELKKELKMLIAKAILEAETEDSEK